MGPIATHEISGKAGLSAIPLPEERIDYQIRDSPAGYRPLPGYPKWQVVQDPATPWDPAVVRAMREVDPSIVPLWVTWAYAPPPDQSDKSIFITGRHAVGWHKPECPPQDFHTLMPLGRIAGMAFKRPTRLWKIYHEADKTSDRIGAFVPWSWWMYYNLLEEFSEGGRREGITDREGSAYWSMRQVNKAKWQAEVKQQQEHRQLLADMDAATAPFIKKTLESVRPLDWQLWQQGGWKQAQEQKKIQVGYRSPGPTLRLPGRF